MKYFKCCHKKVQKLSQKVFKSCHKKVFKSCHKKCSKVVTKIVRKLLQKEFILWFVSYKFPTEFIFRSCCI